MTGPVLGAAAGHAEGSTDPMTGPATRVVGFAAILSALLLVVAIGVLTPWRPLPDGAPAVVPDVAGSFPAAQVARNAAYRADLGPWGVLSLVLGIVVAWSALWLVWRLRPSGRPAWLTATVTALAVQVLVTLVGLPAAAHAESVQREYGLSTSTWALWWRDQAVAFAMAAALLTGGILAAGWVVRRFTRSWPWVLATLAAVLTVAGSAAYPLVVEPAFNTVTPLAAGPLRQDIVALGRADGLGTVDVLVANASLRTTGENAHVSGLGATHRVVLDDTTLARASTDPGAVLGIIAHEFGHVVAHDVARGTAIGLLGGVAGVLAGSWLVLRRRLLPGPGDAARWSRRAAALAVALAVTLPYAAAPVTNLVSRHIEAAADVHALDLTRDPDALIRGQQGLAATNLSRLDPTWWQTAFFATHPDPAWRIALARAWAQAPGRR